MQHHETVPLVAVHHGSGPWLYDHDGHRYLDAISSWWVNLFGHANPRINAALKLQLDTLEHAMLAGFTHEPVVALSEQLSALTDDVLGHCFYASDGASAVEIALKMSFHSWRNRGLRGNRRKTLLGALSILNCQKRLCGSQALHFKNPARKLHLFNVPQLGLSLQKLHSGGDTGLIGLGVAQSLLDLLIGH
jgi:hypothetical protein